MGRFEQRFTTVAQPLFWYFFSTPTYPRRLWYGRCIKHLFINSHSFTRKRIHICTCQSKGNQKQRLQCRILVQFFDRVKHVSDSFLLCSTYCLVLRNTRTYSFSPIHIPWLPHIKYRYSTQRLLIPYTHGQTESYGFCYWLASLRHNRYYPCLSWILVLGHRYSKFGLYNYYDLLLLVLFTLATNFPFRFLSFEIDVLFQQ